MSQYTEGDKKFSKGNFFLQFMGGGHGLKKRRYAESILYQKGEYLHLDNLDPKKNNGKKQLRLLSSFLKKQEKE